MTLDQLRALLAVAESGSLQGAAKSLGISRATVDALVKELEASLGLQLLTRTSGGTVLTAPGEHLLPKARRLLADASVLEGGFRAEALGSQKEVHLQLSSALPQFAHITAISALMEQYSDLRIRISLVEGSEKVLSDDVHMRLQFGAVPVSSGFRTFVLAKVPLKLQATAAYLAERKPPESLEELTAHRLLLWCCADDRDGCLPLAGGGLLEITPYLRSHDASLVRALVCRGMGIGLLPVPEVPVPGLSDPVEDVLPGHVGGSVVIRAIIPERLAELEVTRRVVEVTKELSRLYNAGRLVWERET